MWAHSLRVHSIMDTGTRGLSLMVMFCVHYPKAGKECMYSTLVLLLPFYFI